MDSNNIQDEKVELPNFDAIRHYDEDGREYWLARELYPLLGYSRWQRFTPVIEKAKTTCKSLHINESDHFTHVGKMVDLGSGSTRSVEDIALSRYACYLIVQNGDPNKPVIALGQTYFAIQTRRQEISDQNAFNQLNDDEKRLYLRRELVEHNKLLSNAAHDAGVIEPRDYAIFQNHGYKGLYGGLGNKEIHARKGLKKSQKILDHMGHEELAANLFRATQTEAKLRRDHVIGKENANRTHFQVGQEVRETIRRLGGTMPEDLPTPAKSIQQLQREQRKLLEGVDAKKQLEKK